MMISVVIVLSSLVVVSALFDGQEFDGFARRADVAIGGVLAWRKVQFVIVVIAAATATAGLRFVGLP